MVNKVICLGRIARDDVQQGYLSCRHRQMTVNKAICHGDIARNDGQQGYLSCRHRLMTVNKAICHGDIARDDGQQGYLSCRHRLMTVNKAICPGDIARDDGQQGYLSRTEGRHHRKRCTGQGVRQKANKGVKELGVCVALFIPLGCQLMRDVCFPLTLAPSVASITLCHIFSISLRPPVFFPFYN